MEAITTKYHGPTNTKGARIGANVMRDGKRCSYFYPYKYDLNSEENHIRAARLTAERMGLTNTRWHAGEVRAGYVFVAELAGPRFAVTHDNNYGRIAR